MKNQGLNFFLFFLVFDLSLNLFFSYNRGVLIINRSYFMKNFIFSFVLLFTTSFVLFTPEVHAKEGQKRYHRQNHRHVEKKKSRSVQSFFNLSLNLGAPHYVEPVPVVYPYETQVYYTQPVHVVERMAPVPVYEERVYYPAYRSYSYWGY
jgi:hypothetical protein